MRLVWAAALTLLMPGLGHVVRGWVGRGLAVWSAVLAMGTAGLLAWSVFYPPLITTAVLVVLGWMALIALLWRDLDRLGPAPQRPPPWGVVPVFLVCVGGVPVAAGLQLASQHLMGSTRVADDGMFPRLLEGDRVLFDRRAHRRRLPRPGDLVVVDLGEQRAAVARVLAVAGQTIHLRHGRPVVDGEPVPRGPAGRLMVARLEGAEAERLKQVDAYQETLAGRAWHVTWDTSAEVLPDPEPVRLRPGEIYVVGDHRPSALAHGAYGRVTLDQVQGVPRLIWASVDPEGHRRAGRGGLPLD